MTYLITPYHEAIRISDNQYYMVYDGPTFAVVQTSYYHGGSNTCNISPKFLYEDYIDDGIDESFAKSEALFYATEWLEDLLVRLATNPTIVHCTIDGEMFCR